jgi:hypothetical protein
MIIAFAATKIGVTQKKQNKPGLQKKEKLLPVEKQIRLCIITSLMIVGLAPGAYSSG